MLVVVFKVGLYVRDLHPIVLIVVVFVGRLVILYGYLVAVMKQIGYVRCYTAIAARAVLLT